MLYRDQKAITSSAGPSYLRMRVLITLRKEISWAHFYFISQQIPNAHFMFPHLDDNEKGCRLVGPSGYLDMFPSLWKVIEEKRMSCLRKELMNVRCSN